MKCCLLKHPLLRAYCSFLRIFVLQAFPNYSATSLINKDKGMEEDKKVVEFLSKQKHVKLAYLFGSVAEGRKGKERKGKES